MKKTIRVSAFLLERYNIGEVTVLEKIRVRKALAGDPSLAAALAELKRGDQNFRTRFPRQQFSPSGKKIRYFRPHPVVWGLCAAAMLAVVFFPMFILKTPSGSITDRIKGTSGGEVSAEINVYLRGNYAGEDIILPDRAAIHAGNTVQLVYRVQPESGVEQYGVIFSIDGRSVVTMHYPYNAWQSTRLVSGKQVPLDEAYTLDDAPDYEMFFFVVGDEPLVIMNVLDTARDLAALIAQNPQGALQHGTAAFESCEVQIITLLKE